MTIQARLLLVAAVPAVALAATVFLLRSGAPSGTAIVAMAVAAVGAAVAGALAMAVAGSISTPLRQLGQAADRASNLPSLVEALRRPGGDQNLTLTPGGLPPGGEIGSVAHSFDAFQGAAARLAVGQAALLNKTVAEKGTVEIFVNLARRMQGLVDHQIEFLDGLEAEEQDPDTLENLFQLDQLATRVRRNAESLLTLAGAASARSWERPLAMSDVIRAGMAEVEDLGRVDLLLDDNAAILGNVAADAAHLLSELLENATRWSPPETRVEVSARPAAGGYAITIEDRGIGMADDALAEANHILTGPPLAEATVARSLGLVVTGRLARRLGIVVRLALNPSGGIVAKVLIPPDLMVAADGAAMEEVASGAARTLPFALARQEKRARISSQRSRRRAVPAEETTEATITPLPTSRWMDEAPPAEPVSVEPSVSVEPDWTPSQSEWTPSQSEWTPVEPEWTPAQTEWTTPEPAWGEVEPEPVAHSEPEWPAAVACDPSVVVAPVEDRPPAIAADEREAPDQPEEPVVEVEPEAEPTIHAASPSLPQWEPPPPPPPLPTRSAGPVTPLPTRRIEWPTADPPAAAPAPTPVEPAAVVRATEPSVPVPLVVEPARAAEPPAPAAASPVPPSPVPAPPPAAPEQPAVRPAPMVRPARFAAASSRALAGDTPVGEDPAADTKEDEYRRHLERATAAGLVRRIPKASLPMDTGGGAVRAPKTGGGQPVAERLPDEVRSLLSSYRSGVQRGRADGPSDDQRPTTPQEQP